MTSRHWSSDAIFYHLYPLGALGAPARNDFVSPPAPRLERLLEYVEHWRGLGINALYLGPIFESSAHGYDTADYLHVDRRLGDNALLARVVAELHRHDIKVVLDGVFHHVGRDFWAFRELLDRGKQAPHRAWFKNVRFGKRSPYGDPFVYDTWNGCPDLVKLDLDQAEVRAHLLHAVSRWIEELDIDGLRLDVAESVEPSFLRELGELCRARRADFWLMGEMVHGDYRRIAAPGLLDSATNYELYKALWSSLNDRNYFEIAFALDRQFGPYGIYAGLDLYAFADNHDVDRVASVLSDRAYLYPLYLLLFTAPGVPSIYYGSEWGLEGRKRDGDAALRPELTVDGPRNGAPAPELCRAIARFARLRRDAPALRHGSYRQLAVEHDRFAFLRELGDDRVIVALSAAHGPASLDLRLPELDGMTLVDMLNDGERFCVEEERVTLPLYPCWGRVLRFEAATPGGAEHD